jgi:quinolinate synthase
MCNDDIIDKIQILKKEFGKKVVIPAHHYQNIEIVKLADFIGDSYKLSVDSSKANSQYIVFCGVRFMAESAKILSKDDQKVLIPNIQAGCPMADMIDLKIANKVYDVMSSNCNNEIIPVVYMNSYADMKSFTGEKNGAVCTSSNARKILEYYFKKGKSVFFFPDFHLGKNTANAMGISIDEVVKVKKDATLETSGDVRKAKIFLWDGFCHVHQTFTEGDIKIIREKSPDTKIIVHPECNENVVKLSDVSGSTEQIYKTIKDSPEGSSWAVGTEANFISRIAHDFPDKTITPLRTSACFNMEKIKLQTLFDSLQSIVDFENGKGDLKYEINVDKIFKENANKALKKMIEIVEG